MTIDSTANVLSSTGGIILAGKIFEKIGLNSPPDGTLNSPEKSVLTTMAGLLVEGRNSFAEVDLVRNDPLFRKAMSLDFVYAPETVRLYLERLVETSKAKVLRSLESSNLSLLKRVGLSSIETDKATYLPVDIDVTPMDNSGSNKEGVSFTYKKFDGYAPIFSYIGTEGYMLNCELRQGKQHCQKGTPAFLEETLQMIEELNTSDPVLFRLDSGNDSIDNLIPLMQRDHFFLIKKNLRREFREKWVDLAMSLGKKRSPGRGKRYLQVR